MNRSPSTPSSSAAAASVPAWPRRLSDEGYTVTVIDRTTRAVRRLEGIDRRPAWSGMGYDRGTLLEAGVERAEVLAAVTNGDNTNIVVARTAREHYNVPRVVARIYDPRRAAIYERLGITTVASAQLTTELAVRRVLARRCGRALGRSERQRLRRGPNCPSDTRRACPHRDRTYRVSSGS